MFISIFSLSLLYLYLFFSCYLLVPTYYQHLYIAEVLYNINIEYCYIGIILFIYLFSCAFTKFQ